MQPTIRQATLDDMQGILDIYNDAIINYHSSIPI